MIPICTPCQKWSFYIVEKQNILDNKEQRKFKDKTNIKPNDKIYDVKKPLNNETQISNLLQNSLLFILRTHVFPVQKFFSKISQD